MVLACSSQHHRAVKEHRVIVGQVVDMEPPDDVTEPVHHPPAADVMPPEAALQHLLVPALQACRLQAMRSNSRSCSTKALIGVDNRARLLHVCQRCLIGQPLPPHKVTDGNGAAPGHALGAVDQHRACRQRLQEKHRSTAGQPMVNQSS